METTSTRKRSPSPTSPRMPTFDLWWTYTTTIEATTDVQAITSAILDMPSHKSDTLTDQQKQRDLFHYFYNTARNRVASSNKHSIALAFLADFYRDETVIDDKSQQELTYSKSKKELTYWQIQSIFRSLYNYLAARENTETDVLIPSLLNNFNTQFIHDNTPAQTYTCFVEFLELNSAIKDKLSLLGHTFSPRTRDTGQANNGRRFLAQPTATGSTSAASLYITSTASASTATSITAPTMLNISGVDAGLTLEPGQGDPNNLNHIFYAANAAGGRYKLSVTNGNATESPTSSHHDLENGACSSGSSMNLLDFFKGVAYYGPAGQNRAQRFLEQNLILADTPQKAWIKIKFYYDTEGGNWNEGSFKTLLLNALYDYFGTLGTTRPEKPNPESATAFLNQAIRRSAPVATATATTTTTATTTPSRPPQ